MTRSTANNRKTSANNRKTIASVWLRSPSELKPVAALERGLATRAREMGLGVQTEPVREMRLHVGLEMQVVYFTLRMPIGSGIKLRLPVITTITPKFYSPTRAQHPEHDQGQH